MTNRLTNGGGKPQAENAGIKGFARFNVRDSFSIPATDSSAGGSTPDSGSQTSQRVSKKQLLEMDSRLGERDRELLGVVQQYRYAMYLSGMGCAKIAKELTIEGGLSPRGAGWSEWCIKDILTNEKYKGDLLLQKYYTPDFRTKKHAVNRGERRQYYVEDSHEPIVGKETFEAVRQERERRRKKYCHAPQDNQKKHLFCGLIRCGCCGSTYKFIRNNKRAVWICPKHWKKGPSICPSRQIPENILIKKTQDVLGLRRHHSPNPYRKNP